MTGSFKKLLLCTLVPAICICTTSCAPQKEEEVVVIENEDNTSLYGLISVTTDDVILSKGVTCTYTQTKEQSVSFPSGGKRVLKVFVNAGDSVKKGDVLIELVNDGVAEQIDELDYKIKKNTKQLSYLDKAQEFDEQAAYIDFVVNTDKEEDDLKKYDKKLEDIRQDYRYKREDYADEIEFDQKKLAKLKAELSGSTVNSTMDGIVYTVKEGLEGSTSRKDEVVMTIVDNSSGFFESADPDCLKYFKDGDIISMDIVYGNASGSYELTPNSRSSWSDDLQRYSIVSSPENDGIDVGTTGTLKIILDKKEKVLSLPIGAINYADGKPYVYMLDDNGFKQMVWVSVGLVGDDLVEITDGLSEGDKVVYR